MSRHAAVLAAAGLVAGSAWMLASTDSAQAMTVRQVDATMGTAKLEFTPGPHEEIVRIDGLEVKTYNTEEWLPVPSEYIESLSTEGASLMFLEPGSLLAQVKVCYTLKYGGSSVATSAESAVLGIKTVAAPASNVKIAGQLFDTKKLKLSFANPGAIDGYQVKLAATSGKDNASFSYSYPRTTQTSKSRLATAYFDTKLDCVYKVRVRTWVTMGDADKTKRYSKWSAATALVPQPDAWGTGSGKRAKVAWTKVKGAASYSVYASTKRSGGFKKVATVRSTSLPATKVAGKRFAAGKKTYFYVRATAKLGKKTYTSPASAVYSL